MAKKESAAPQLTHEELAAQGWMCKGPCRWNVEVLEQLYYAHSTGELRWIVVPEAVDSPALTLTSLTPNFSLMGDLPDITMSAKGTGFLPTSTLTFNGGDEVTIFVSSTELTTIVKPSTAQVAGSYPVTVKRDGEESAPLMFTFAEAGMTRTEEKAPRSKK